MKYLIGFLKLVRFPNLAIIFLTQYAIRFGIIYPFLDQGGLPLFLDEKLFAMLAIATVSIAAAGYIIKFDRENFTKRRILYFLMSFDAQMFWSVIVSYSQVIQKSSKRSAR